MRGKRRNLLIEKLCEYCGEPYMAAINKATIQKYCNDKCNNHADYERNKERYGKMTKEWRRKNPERYCTWVKRWQQERQEGFRLMKEEIGCQICGYSKWGESLDWHHLFKKSHVISASYWYKNSEEFQLELERCILLCKNCHFEVKHD